MGTFGYKPHIVVSGDANPRLDGAVQVTRRELLLAGLAAQSLGAQMPTPRLGLDLFSLRSQGWTAFQQLDFAHAHGASLVNFSEPRFLGGTASDHLKRVREHADSLGIQIEVGFGSICPTSTRFLKEDGTAREQLLKMFGIARILGSPLERRRARRLRKKERADCSWRWPGRFTPISPLTAKRVAGATS